MELRSPFTLRQLLRRGELRRLRRSRHRLHRVLVRGVTLVHLERRAHQIEAEDDRAQAAEIEDPSPRAGGGRLVEGFELVEEDAALE